MKLTTYILVKDNEKTIDQTLKSILPLKSKVVIGDIGSIDSTLKICQNYDVKIIKTPFLNDLSASKNKLMTTEGWRFWIEPWETLVKGHKSILDAVEGKPDTYHLQIIQGHIINKETRLWHSNQNKYFYNPCYETVGNDGKFVNTILFSSPTPNLKEQWDLLQKWKVNRPTDREPYYYQSFLLLAQGKYSEFISSVEQYIFSGGQDTSAVMAKYYLATVQLYVLKDASTALRNILPCISIMPLMAEFWCILGDIYYQKKQYKKAIAFYNNAIVLGSRRLRSDLWPMDIPKYEEYPNKMIASCKNIIKETKVYQIRNQAH